MRVERERAGDQVRAGMSLIGPDGAYAGLVVVAVAERGRIVHVEGIRPHGRGRWRVPVESVVRVVDQAVRLASDCDADLGPRLRGVA